MRLIRSRSLALPLLLTAAMVGVADAAIVFDGATVTATATAIGTGLNVNGVTKTRIDESTYTATVASSSTSGPPKRVY